jgi:signal transduction histidine kinase
VTDRPEDEVVISPEAQRLHDLRQPLSAIMAAASALRLHTGLTEEERDAFLRVIAQSAERLSEMLEEPDSPS